MHRDLFVAGLPSPIAEAFAERAGLEVSIASWLERATAACPGFAPAPEVFLPYLAARFTCEQAVLCIEDLALACACVSGDRRALEALEAGWLRDDVEVARDLSVRKADVDGIEAAGVPSDRGLDPAWSGRLRARTHRRRWQRLDRLVQALDHDRVGAGERRDDSPELVEPGRQAPLDRLERRRLASDFDDDGR